MATPVGSNPLITRTNSDTPLTQGKKSRRSHSQQQTPSNAAAVAQVTNTVVHRKNNPGILQALTSRRKKQVNFESETPKANVANPVSHNSFQETAEPFLESDSIDFFPATTERTSQAKELPSSSVPQTPEKESSFSHASSNKKSKGAVEKKESSSASSSSASNKTRKKSKKEESSSSESETESSSSESESESTSSSSGSSSASSSSGSSSASSSSESDSDSDSSSVEETKSSKKSTKKAAAKKEAAETAEKARLADFDAGTKHVVQELGKIYNSIPEKHQDPVFANLCHSARTLTDRAVIKEMCKQGRQVIIHATFLNKIPKDLKAEVSVEKGKWTKHDVTIIKNGNVAILMFFVKNGVQVREEQKKAHTLQVKLSIPKETDSNATCRPLEQAGKPLTVDLRAHGHIVFTGADQVTFK